MKIISAHKVDSNEFVGLEVIYEHEGKRKGLGFTDYNEAMEIVDGEERFIKKIREKILASKKEDTTYRNYELTKFKGKEYAV